MLLSFVSIFLAASGALYGAPILSDEVKPLYNCSPFDIFAKPRIKNLSPLREQGLKIHVGATEHSAAKIANFICPILVKHDIRHKIVHSTEGLSRLEQDKIQSGKFITIYLNNDTEAAQWAISLELSLSCEFQQKDFKCPQYEYLVKDTLNTRKPLAGGVSFRYGSFSGDPTIKLIDQSGVYQRTSQGDCVTCYDDRFSYKPDFMTWETSVEHYGPKIKDIDGEDFEEIFSAVQAIFESGKLWNYERQMGVNDEEDSSFDGMQENLPLLWDPSKKNCLTLTLPDDKRQKLFTRA
jgi:hypothetical protein